MMPGLDGFALLGSLRSDPKTQDISIILLSARAGEEACIEGLEAGADDYLIKSFSARELLARIEANLKLANLRRTAYKREQILRLFNLSIIILPGIVGLKIAFIQLQKELNQIYCSYSCNCLCWATERAAGNKGRF